MLEKLTPEQEVLMQQVKQEWLDRLFNCSTVIDKEKVTQKVKWLYTFCDLTEPEVIFVDSPMACQKEALRIKKEHGDTDESYVSFSSYGNIWDYGWVAFYDFFTRIGVINNPDFNNFKELLEAGVYDMIQLDGYCIVSSLPNMINRDEQNRLHCENKPAIRFRDGYELYYWHGVNIPKGWITNKEKITRDVVVGEKNAEKRRCLQEILGSKKFAQLLDIQTLDSDFEYFIKEAKPNGRVTFTRTEKDKGNNVVKFPIELFRTKEKDTIINDYIYFLHVQCPSTDREYFLCVPECKTAWEAKAWTFKKDPATFNLVVES